MKYSHLAKANKLGFIEKTRCFKDPTVSEREKENTEKPKNPKNKKTK